MKKALPLLFLLILSACSGSASSEMEDNIDHSVLQEIGIPDDTLESLSLLEKNRMATYLDDSSEFLTFQMVDEVYFDDQPADIQFSLAVFKQKNGNYAFFPSFMWSESVRLSNDAFVFRVNQESWNHVAVEDTLAIHGETNFLNNPYYHLSDGASGLYPGGVHFNMSDLSNRSLSDVEGVAYFELEPTEENFDPTELQFSFTYAHISSITGRASVDTEIVDEHIQFSSDDSNFHQTRVIIDF